MNPEISYEELATLIKTRAGVQVSVDQLADPGCMFLDLGVDSLGVLGVLADLENRYGVSIDSSDLLGRPVAEFLKTVNSTVKAGA
ncbi:acyl carrier protein [Kitasatospora cheerisanensis]|uniref:Putative acyl carrier protein n=1 Tax=Kitasatospora cheerisanensis KCTC 2395 TaxID=1348663 RepID=A0A066YH95_9ACTN|nr:acyl carrier protein [Kitasatospora cheerisanensis]KDN80863.1 putative acyl carrier protein [Kitasatospora cheerisanensis KCTC 2395]